jgi:glucose/arabinose dehydrogenase
MPMKRRTTFTIACLLAGCAADTSRLPPGADVGPTPVLSEPVSSLLPTIQVAPAVGWPQGMTPRPREGFTVTAFAAGLDHPRWLHVLPNGDVLVAETNAPPRPDEGKGFKGFFMKLFMKKAGAGVPSANRITLLRDRDGDGIAETRSVLLSGLNSPFGMALVGRDFFVANADAVMRFPYTEGALTIDAPGTKLADLPGGPLNHHWTKGLVATPDGKSLYAMVGSNSNVAEHGMEVEQGRAAVWEIDIATGKSRVYASGLRNPVGAAFPPGTRRLWVVVNERDELGSDLVPDYLTAVHEGAFYGWPYSYYGSNVDHRVHPQRPDLVQGARKPNYALGSHVAPLGLAFAEGLQWPAPFDRGAFVGQHGSWNRRPPNGYNVVFVPFAGDTPIAKPVEVLGGFLSPDAKAYGRPAGVAVDKRNGLLVADDVGNTVWRVAPAGR